MLVFGAGTDYALLLISRYRDELRVTPDRREAMATALRRTAEAVVSSAATVVLGLLTLLLSLFPATRGLGLACAIGVVVAATFALVVLPAALVVFGRWIFWPKVPHVGQTGLADGHSFWRRVGDAVAATPRGASSPSPSSRWPSSRAASARSRPASTRPTSSSRSRRPSPRESGSPSPSRPAPPTRPGS